MLGTGRQACWQEKDTAAVREWLDWHGVAEEMQRTKWPWCPGRASFRAVLPVKWEFYYCLTASWTYTGSKEKAFEVWCAGYTCAGPVVVMHYQTNLDLIPVPPVTGWVTQSLSELRYNMRTIKIIATTHITHILYAGTVRIYAYVFI